MASLRNSCLLTFSPLILRRLFVNKLARAEKDLSASVEEAWIQRYFLTRIIKLGNFAWFFFQSLWFNRNYEIENPSFRSLKIFIRQTDKWHCQINANCQLTSQRVVVAITVCAAWCAWTVNGAGPDVVSGCACIASFEFRRGKFKRSEEKFLNRHGTSKFLIVIWFITCGSLIYFCFGIRYMCQKSKFKFANGKYE